MKKKNEIILSFNIWNFEDMSHTDISNQLNIQPGKVYIKGEKKKSKNMNQNSPLVRNNGWIMESGLDKYSFFEDQMKNLLDLLEPRIDILKLFGRRYDCEFSCALFIYRDNGESTPSVHLNERYNNFIKQVNVEFDIDLYVL